MRVRSMMFGVILLVSITGIARADDVCDPLSDPNHRPTQWEHLCHQGARGQVPNDPTQKNPSSRFTFSPSDALEPGDVVTFDGSTSITRDGRPMRDWVWDFGDGAQATGTVVEHAYATEGQFVAALWVHDSIGWRGHSTKLVTIGALAAQTAVRETYSIPTRASGGASLVARVTRPDAPGSYPVVLTYGPYCSFHLGDADKTFSLVRSGYAFATVTAPGLCGSTGRFDMFGANSRTAGYDAVEWLAAQPWSNGKVALTGFSGPAVGALLTASARPPHLRAAAIMATLGDQYRDIIYPGGILNSNSFVNAWRTLLLNDPELQTKTQPLIDDWAEDLRNMVQHPTFDGFWKQRSIVDYATPRAPVLVIGSHHDLWPRSLFEIARWIRPAGGRVIQCVGSHGCGDPSGYASPEFLPAGGEARAWLEHYLKGAQNGVEARPGILTYASHGGDIAGYGFDAGTWTGLDAWPESIDAWRTYYLNPAPSTGSILSLTSAAPVEPVSAVPALVPWTPAQGAQRGDTSALAQGAGLPEFQNVDEAQTLTYETPVLARDLRVVGPMTLRLRATPLTPDFAFSVQIDDLWRDGSANWISEGYLLASHRALDRSRSLRNGAGEIVRPYHPHTAASVQTLIPGTTYEFQIEIWGVANVFRAGHRLRLTIGGQNAGWRQNASPGAAFVEHGSSSLLLPVVPMSEDADPRPYA